MDRDESKKVNPGAPIDRRAFVRGTATVAGAASIGSLLTSCGLGGSSGDGAAGSSLAWPPGKQLAQVAPEAAYTRIFGAVPAGVCNSLADQQCRTGVPSPGLRGAGAGVSTPGLGLPLGGIGAGSFMINQCGTFGPWDMGGQPTTGTWEQRTLPQAAFHVREEVLAGDGTLTVKTLAAPHENIAPDRRFGTVLPAWNTLNPGDGKYSVLFPFAWMEYAGFQSKISTKIWSPIISNEDERTSMPVAFFDMQLSNPTKKPMKLSVMLTFPNAPAFATGSRREGLYSRFDLDPVTGIGGVTLGSDSATNTPDTVKSEWTIAARPFPGQTLSHCTSWNGAGDGSDIYAPFSAAKSDGNLPNGNIDGSATAGALAVSFTLAPGRTQTVRFALAWDFPQIFFGNNPNNRAIWMRRYTAFLGGKTTPTNDYVQGSYPFNQGFGIAHKELTRYDDSLAAVESWWKPIAENPKVPAWLRKAALNELYHMTFNGSFWESGLVSSTIQTNAANGTSPRLGSVIPDTHIYYHKDAGGGGAPQNEVDMDSSGYLAFAKLFRGTELGVIRALLQMVRQNPIGIGRVIQQTFQNTGPYISQGASFQQFPPTTPPIFGAPPPNSNDLGELFAQSGGDPFRDCPHKLIYRTYALIKFYNDNDLLKYAYAPLMRALQYVQFFRPAGSHLPMDPPSNNPPNTMDQVPVDGHGIYNCGLYLASLQIMSALTTQAAGLGVQEATPAAKTALDQELAAAKEEFERIFWNPATGRYRFCDGTGGITGRTGNIRGRFKPVPPPDAVWLESFPGQLIVMELGLPDVVNLERARTHLNNTLDQFIRFRDPQGRLMGGPIILKPDFSIYPSSLNTTEINEVIPGICWLAAAGAYRIGKRVGDDGIVSKALQLAEGCAIRIYDDENAGLAFNSPESWFVDDTSVTRFPAYTRTRSIFSLYDAVSPIAVRQPA